MMLGKKLTRSSAWKAASLSWAQDVSSRKLAQALLCAMAHNNAWANFRLLTSCAQLSDAAFQADDRVSFFPSIMQTLNHNLTVDWFYVDALEGGTLGPKAFADETPCTTMAILMPEQAAIDR